jgi:hypothetical protein
VLLRLACVFVCCLISHNCLCLFYIMVPFLMVRKIGLGVDFANLFTGNKLHDDYYHPYLLV